MVRSGHNPKIGLLGGSFNPAHEGHLEISLAALEFLKLDYVWWLVSPGNPLKADSQMTPFEVRFASARDIVTDERIIVSDLEKKIGTRYTIDTLEKMKKMWPDHHFVWLMGADNLIQFDKWKDWRKIADTVPFAIFNRPSYSKESLMSIAAMELAKFHIKKDEAHILHRLKPPAWIYYELSDNPMSSTEIRRNIK
ncbi:MAG: nicotinate-nucleotide adenylyltransferase [Kordiimonadaceae bacterium]|nr:nicotinate-nucleotide adenylyltransferase [Kordiimonadaceae bacterium]